MVILQSFFLASLLLLSSSAYACSPLKAHPVFFEKNSSRIGIVELEKLTMWVSEIRGRHPVLKLIETEAASETTEIDPVQLGWLREFAVRAAMVDLGFRAQRFNPSGEVMVSHPRPVGTAGGIPSRSVWINFFPGCPHECPCEDPVEADAR